MIFFMLDLIFVFNENTNIGFSFITNRLFAVKFYCKKP
jgi:hypothetical protein